MSRVPTALLALSLLIASVAQARAGAAPPHEATPIGGEPEAAPASEQHAPNPFVTFLLAAAGTWHGHDLAVPPASPAAAREPVTVSTVNDVAEAAGNAVVDLAGRPANPGFTLRVDGLAVEGGGGLQLGVGLEARRFGLLADASALRVRTEPALARRDALTLVHALGTFSPWASPRARLRLEAGPSITRGPEALRLGATVGGSLEACLLGALDGELRGLYTFAPYPQVDARAGLALRLSAVSVRLGLRVAHLGEGTLGAAAREETFIGPYFGLGLAL